jgi:hypothetical protein
MNGNRNKYRGKQELKPANRISKARYRDPKQNLLNTEKFTHIRKSTKAKKKVSVGKKIRDVKRMIAHLESQPEPNQEMIE